MSAEFEAVYARKGRPSVPLKHSAHWVRLIGDEHFSVDGTLIEGQADWTGADVLCGLQPGAHGLHGLLVGCTPCVIQGRGASKMGALA